MRTDETCGREWEDALDEQDEADRLDDEASRQARRDSEWRRIQAEDLQARTGCTMREAFRALGTSA